MSLKEPRTGVGDSGIPGLSLWTGCGLTATLCF